jgi:type VI secretion system protein ImpB
MSSQKFIGRNRAPRVQIEYDVELYGAQKKVQLPFVMGVLANLSGKPSEALPPVAERAFLDISVDNFDDRLAGIKPRVAASVPNKLTGEGNLNVEVRFEKMDDFSPAAVARAVPALRKLLEARTQLANLITYMDGKTGAEDLIARVLKDPTLLASLAASAKPSSDAPPRGASTPATTEPGKSE